MDEGAGPLLTFALLAILVAPAIYAQWRDNRRNR